MRCLLSRVILAASVLADVGGAAGQEPAGQAPRLRIEFEGNDRISASKLRGAIKFLLDEIEGREPDAFDVEDCSLEIVRHYRAQGYPEAAVSGALSIDGNVHRITLSIREGRRTFVGEVRFELEGPPSVPLRDLRACFQWTPSGFLGLGAFVFSEASLEEGLTNVIALYQLQGYLDAAVEARPRPPSPVNTVDVVVKITEGKRYYVRDRPRFTGDLSLSGDELFEVLDLSLPAVANPRLRLILRGKLQDFYRNRGHRFVRIQADQERVADTDAVRIGFDIEEGPVVTIGSLRIAGNDRTAEWVIRARLKLREGDVYSEERLRDSYRALLRSGLFTSVLLETDEQPDDENRVGLDIAVREKQPWNLSVLLGWGSYELLRGGVVLENINVFGTGHSARAEGFVSFKGERATLSYLNPRFFHDKISHSAETTLGRREHPSFEHTEYGGGTGLGFLWTKEVRSDLRYRLVQSDVRDARSDVPPELLDDVLLSTISLSSLFEYRQNLLDPRRGSTHRFEIDYTGKPIGADLDFLRYSVRSTWVVPLPWELRLVLNGRAGLLDRLADTDEIPIQERFFNGGERSIRSFLQDEAGPKSGDSPIGGEALLTGNAELRFPIWRDVHGAAFYDIGAVNEDVEDFAGGPYQSGVGGGVRYHTPFGPFRFDAAWNPNRRSGEDTWAFHFALGMPF